MEFVTAEPRAGDTERAVLEQSRGAIAEMQTALGEARRMGEQANHGVTRAVGIDQPLPKHHVAAALAVHRPACGELREPCLEAPGVGERAGMQLGIAAGEPAGIAILRRRLIGERREGDDLGAGAAPAAQHMRIHEGEGGVGGERDALTRRRQCGHGARIGLKRSGKTLNAGEIAIALGKLGEAMQAKLEVVVLERLHQAEVTLGKMDRLVARDGADHRNVERADGAFDRGAMAVAADTIQNDAGDANAGIEAGKAEHRGGGGLRLAVNVEHEQDRQTEVDGKLGRGALADRAGPAPSNRPMADSTIRRSAPADAS